MTPQRKARIKVVRQEGRQAALACRHFQTCPYKPGYPDWMQWMRGYDFGMREMRLELQPGEDVES